MKKKHLAAAVLAATVVSASSSAFAASNPFTDVPQGHWAYDAVAQLAADGVIEGYGDSTFQGDKNITRYEMAQMVAKAMAKKDVSAADKAAIDNLAAEFADELNNLGVRVANLEKNSDNMKWSGMFAQKYMKKYQAYDDNKQRKSGGSPWYEKEFDLNLSAKVPGTDWKVNGAIVTKWGSDGSGGEKGAGFNDERDIPDDWNGGNSRSNEMRLDKVWVEGNLGKTGQYVKFGDFQPWTMNGLVNDANVKGASAEHWGKNYATHIFGGRLDVEDWDVAVNDEPDWGNAHWVGWDTTGYVATQTYNGIGNHYGDFVRKHDTMVRTTTMNSDYQWGGTSNEGWNDGNHTDAWENTGSDNVANPSTGKFSPQRKDIMGAVFDYTFSKKVNGSIGYYGFRSAAYNHDWLHIGAGLLNYKLVRNLNFELMYAHGNQGGHNDAWNIELQFRGNPWIPVDRSHLFGAYLGYRYLGPDALIKSNFGDGVDEGQKGWEVGMFYNLMKNCQYTLKYFNGHSITFQNEKRSKVFTSLSWNF